MRCLCYICVCVCVCVYVCLNSIWSNVSFKASVLFCFLLFIYCLGDLSIDLRGMSKFPAIIVLLSVFLFMSVNICFIYSHSYLGCVCYIFFLDWSLDHYVMSIPVRSLTCWCVDCILRLQGCDFLWLVSTL